jgi:prepilin-type N-terminal cleavage/methylation domain-containing protein
MRASETRRRQGFTLIELMIVVAIIGLLAAVAIPNFQRYQNKARRTEGFTNLASLAKAQKAYHAEFGIFVGVLAEPLGTTGVPPHTQKRPSESVAEAFSVVGWRPEGDVFFDYDTNTKGIACDCESCFTSTAYGDVDGDGGLSLLLFTHPSVDQTESCNSALSPGEGTPQKGPNGNWLWDQVNVSILGDDF